MVINPVSRITVAFCLALAAVPAIGQPDPLPKSTEQWQALAAADLKAVREALRSSHPGAIDEANPEFQQLVESGYAQAQQLIPRVTDYQSAIAAVRSYVTLFRDGHLAYSDNVRQASDVVESNGIGISLVKGRYVVNAVLPEWPVALPPVGAELVSCDGLTPRQISDQRHAPYYSRRQTGSDLQVLASQMNIRDFAGDELKQCTYRTPQGQVLELDVKYRSFQTNAYFREVMPALAKGMPVAPAERGNAYTFSDGVLWIHAANFNLRAESSEAADLEKMLTEITALTGVKHIVFDARGNRGGDSRIGGKIFNAATGGLEYDQENLDGLQRTYAQWRVSDVAIAMLAWQIERMHKMHGADSAPAREAAAMHQRLLDAKAAGEPWFRQDGSYRITQADIARRGGHLRRFDGTLVLVTDQECASACLDFADLVRSVPASVHMGQTTSADTVYLERGSQKLPSGNLLFMPLKVWRNRLRGNNEPWVPQVPLTVDMSDTAAVRSAVLGVIASRRQSKPAEN